MPQPDPSATPRPRGRITVVWGTGGAPGRSTVALNLAVEQALLGQRVSLVDADSYGASLASMLGLLDETAGLVRLCRLVEAGTFQAQADSAASARVDIAGASLHFTSGLPRPERWAELSAQAVKRALLALAETHDEVVVDVAAPIGRDDELALDSFAPQRNDAAVAALEAADRVFVVGRADAVGLPRLIRLCEEVVQRPGRPPVVVINQLRAQASGPRPEQALRVAWRRFGPITLMPRVYLPWDPVAADASLLQGSALAEAAPRSPLRLAIRDWVAAQQAESDTQSHAGGAASAPSGIPYPTPAAHATEGLTTG
ncbi:MinD/ParA family ATP-binding protein [Galactobacter caseinivorans]|uniref:MinD/ParA family ATP-binding protein n=1 Tax=Galactobacter caseinivorans TaxID=2676123 RepID=UPI001314585C|nr:P-loop NTPase [Galactobacter caseinivorans]